MTRYGIKRMDTGDVLPEPYTYDSMTGAEAGVHGILEIYRLLKMDEKPPCLEVVLLKDGD